MTKLRDVLLPKPFVGVVLWVAAAIVLVLWMFAVPKEVQRVLSPPRTEAIVNVIAKPIASLIKVEGSTATRSAADVAGNEDESSPDRTHDVVVRVDPSLTEAQGLRVGEASSNAIDSATDPEASIQVTREALDGGELRVVVTRSTGYEFQSVELTTDRRHRSMRCLVQSGTDATPTRYWSDVNGEVTLNTWEWSSTKPLILEYSLNGVRRGRRQCVHDRIVIDF